MSKESFTLMNNVLIVIYVERLLRIILPVKMDGGYSYVYKQPENEEELELCVEAMEGCPVEAIGDDG
jgi:hypothetical protein